MEFDVTLVNAVILARYEPHVVCIGRVRSARQMTDFGDSGLHRASFDQRRVLANHLKKIAIAGFVSEANDRRSRVDRASRLTPGAIPRPSTITLSAHGAC